MISVLEMHPWVFQNGCQWTVRYTPLLVIQAVGINEIIQRKYKKIEIKKNPKEIGGLRVRNIQRK